MIPLALVMSLPLPPPQYDHAPTKPYSVEYVSEAYMREQDCKGYRLFGCTCLDSYILLHEDLTPEAAERVLRHELGHVNGWEH